MDETLSTFALAISVVDEWRLAPRVLLRRYCAAQTDRDDRFELCAADKFKHRACNGFHRRCDRELRRAATAM